MARARKPAIAPSQLKVEEICAVRATLRMRDGMIMFAYSFVLVYARFQSNVCARSLSELATTETELTLIAAAAIIGFNRRAKNG